MSSTFTVLDAEAMEVFDTAGYEAILAGHAAEVDWPEFYLKRWPTHTFLGPGMTEDWVNVQLQGRFEAAGKPPGMTPGVWTNERLTCEDAVFLRDRCVLQLQGWRARRLKRPMDRRPLTEHDERLECALYQLLLVLQTAAHLGLGLQYEGWSRGRVFAGCRA